jgi:hypothetical protein
VIELTTENTDSQPEPASNGTAEDGQKDLKFASEPLKTLAIADECNRLAATIRYDDEKDLAEGDEVRVIPVDIQEEWGVATVEHTDVVPVYRALDVVSEWWAEYGIEHQAELCRVLNEYYDDVINSKTEVKVVILDPDLDGEWLRSTDTDRVTCPSCGRTIRASSALCVCGMVYPGSRGDSDAE